MSVSVRKITSMFSFFSISVSSNSLTMSPLLIFQVLQISTFLFTVLLLSVLLELSLFDFFTFEIGIVVGLDFPILFESGFLAVVPLEIGTPV